MGWLTGLEPATTSATNWRSTNWTTVTIIIKFITILTYFQKNGAGDEGRTRDIQLGRLTLYQLSYSRIFIDGRCSRIWTCDPLLPRQVRYRAALYTVLYFLSSLDKKYNTILSKNCQLLFFIFLGFFLKTTSKPYFINILIILFFEIIFLKIILFQKFYPLHLLNLDKYTPFLSILYQ